MIGRLDNVDVCSSLNPLHPPVVTWMWLSLTFFFVLPSSADCVLPCFCLLYPAAICLRGPPAYAYGSVQYGYACFGEHMKECVSVS